MCPDFFQATLPPPKNMPHHSAIHLSTIVLLWCFQFISSSPRHIVGRFILSTCHKVPGTTIVQSYIHLPENDKFAWCKRLHQLSPPELYKYFECEDDIDGSTNHPYKILTTPPLLAVFNANIFNTPTEFPFQGNERVGEMSFEIQTKQLNNNRIKQDTPQYVDRYLWSDGAVGEWQASQCNEVGDHQATVNFLVQGTGYHRTLVTNIQIQQQQLQKGIANYITAQQCNVAIAYTMEAGQYMDLDELREAQPYSLVTATSGSWSIDVEKPAEQSTRHMVVLQTTTCPATDRNKGEEEKINYTFRTPVHFRYQRASLDFTTLPSCILPPQIFMQCQDSCGSDTTVKWQHVGNVMVEQAGGETKASPSVAVCSNVPVGNANQGTFVSYVTALSTFAGAGAIFYSMRK